MKTNLFLLLLLSLLASCQNNPPKKDGPGIVVDIDSDEEFVVTEKEDLEINEGVSETGEIVGPITDNNSSESEKKKARKNPVIALNLGPGLYRSACYLGVFQELEKERVNIRMISGLGFSSVLASLYAMGISQNVIEWRMFRFFKQANKRNAFEDKWRKLVFNSFLEEYKNKKIQNSKILLLLPKLNESGKEIRYVSRGNLSSLIEDNLDMNQLGPQIKSVYNEIDFKKLGADIVLSLDILGEDIHFVKGNDYLTGIYGKIINLTQKNKQGGAHIVSLPAEDMPLDSEKGLSTTIQKCQRAGKEVILKINSLVRDWEQEREKDQ